MSKLRSKKIAVVRNLTILGIVVAASPSGLRMLRAFESADPFANLRRTPPPKGRFLMRLENVKFRHYSGDRLVTSADCNRIDLAPDRQSFDLFDVHNASFKGEQGSFNYEARHAVYQEGVGQLFADGGVTVRNADLNLRAQRLTFTRRTKVLNVLGGVDGTVKGGETHTQNVSYHVDSGAFSAGPTRWTGPLALALQDEEKPKQSKWDVHGRQVHYTGKSGKIWAYDDGIATDGEIIVIAPKVVHDQNSDVITCTGRVQYFSAKANIVADQCVVYRKEKRAVLVGNVQMLVKPKKDENSKPQVEPIPAFQPLNPDQVVATPPPPRKAEDPERKQDEKLRDSKSIRDYPMAINSAKIEYWYAKGARRAVITGAPQARQEQPGKRWRHVWTNVAFYDGEAETLKLVSTKGLQDTRMKDSIGDDLVADWMEISTKEDDDRMSGQNFKGTIVSLDEDELPKSDSGPSGKPAPQPPKTGPGTPPPNKGGNPPPTNKTGGSTG